MSAFRPLLGLIGAVTLAAGIVVAAPPAATAAPAPPYASVVQGTTSPVHRLPAAGPNAASTRPKGHRRLTSVGAQIKGQTPPTAAADTATAAGTLLHNFNGVSSRDSEVTNFNADFEPPDQGLCAGNGFVLEAVNSAYTIYTPTGHATRGPFNVNDLFNEGASEFTSDPRCYYDPTTHTWFATILFLNAPSPKVDSTSP